MSKKKYTTKYERTEAKRAFFITNENNIIGIVHNTVIKLKVWASKKIRYPKSIYIKNLVCFNL